MNQIRGIRYVNSDQTNRIRGWAKKKLQMAITKSKKKKVPKADLQKFSHYFHCQRFAKIPG